MDFKPSGCLVSVLVGERAPHIKDLDLKSDNFPLDKALGIHWDVERDTIDFVFSERDS